ncbi:hypothetical protein FQZ97_804610 [compost metagenome]
MALPLRTGHAQRAVAAGVGVAQGLEVVAATGQHFLPLGAVDLLEVGLDATVAVPVGLEEAVLVAIDPGEARPGRTPTYSCRWA